MKQRSIASFRRSMRRLRNRRNLTKIGMNLQPRLKWQSLISKKKRRSNLEASRESLMHPRLTRETSSKRTNVWVLLTSLICFLVRLKQRRI
jgi:hypothetical protein